MCLEDQKHLMLAVGLHTFPLLRFTLHTLCLPCMYLQYFKVIIAIQYRFSSPFAQIPLSRRFPFPLRSDLHSQKHFVVLQCFTPITQTKYLDCHTFHFTCFIHYAAAPFYLYLHVSSFPSTVRSHQYIVDMLFVTLFIVVSS
jgi:hypothetical protein